MEYFFKARTFPYDACHRALATLPARFSSTRPWLLTNLDILLYDLCRIVRKFNGSLSQVSLIIDWYSRLRIDKYLSVSGCVAQMHSSLFQSMVFTHIFKIIRTLMFISSHLFKGLAYRVRQIFMPFQHWKPLTMLRTMAYMW